MRSFYLTLKLSVVPVLVKLSARDQEARPRIEGITRKSSSLTLRATPSVTSTFSTGRNESLGLVLLKSLILA